MQCWSGSAGYIEVGTVLLYLLSLCYFYLDRSSIACELKGFFVLASLIALKYLHFIYLSILFRNDGSRECGGGGGSSTGGIDGLPGTGGQK